MRRKKTTQADSLFDAGERSTAKKTSRARTSTQTAKAKDCGCEIEKLWMFEGVDGFPSYSTDGRKLYYCEKHEQTVVR